MSEKLTWEKWFSEKNLLEQEQKELGRYIQERQSEINRRWKELQNNRPE